MSDFQRNRELLGVRLRELRRNAGITGVELARQLGWMQSKVSRLECGRQTASRDDIEAWVARIRGLETTVVPGLLQTSDYARHRLAEQPDLHHIPEDVPAALAARMQRQQVIYDTGKQFHFILAESVLRNRLCPPDVMRGQLDRLTMALGLPNLKLGILPFSARLPVAPLNGFWIFDEVLVTFETIAAEVHVRDPDEVTLYARVFEQFDQVSVYGNEAKAVLAEAFQAL